MCYNVWKIKNSSRPVDLDKEEKLKVVHKLSEFCEEIVFTGGESAIESVREIPKEIKDKIDIVIDAGKLGGMPSILIIDGKEVRR